MVNIAQYSPGKRITHAFMANWDSVELHAQWVAAQDISRFQELLNAEAEDGKYKILAQLLHMDTTFIAVRPFPNLGQLYDVANVP
jgi:hypothetical protein